MSFVTLSYSIKAVEGANQGFCICTDSANGGAENTPGTWQLNFFFLSEGDSPDMNCDPGEN